MFQGPPRSKIKTRGQPAVTRSSFDDSRDDDERSSMLYASTADWVVSQVRDLSSSDRSRSTAEGMTDWTAISMVITN